MRTSFKIPLQSEVEKYIKERKGWPDNFCRHYAEKFWNHYQASGWKLSSGNSIKDWKACFNAQWQVLKFKEDIDMLNGFKPKETVTGSTIGEVNRLDQFLQKYISRPGDIPFDAFGRWYEYMKAEKLLTISKEKGLELMEIYKGNKEKCRCAAVQITLDGYVKGGFTFSKIFELRLKMIV